MARQKRMGFFVERLSDGLSLGTIYALLGVAYSLCWGANRPLILANAAFFVIGAAVLLASMSTGTIAGPNLAPLTLPLGMLAANVAAAGAATGLRAVFAPSAETSAMRTLIPCAGLLLMSVAALQFSTRLPVAVVFSPASAPRLGLSLPGLPPFTIPAVQAVILVAGMSFIFAVLCLYRFTRFGHAHRAASQDIQMAELYGIHTRRVAMISLLTGSAIASSAGAMSVMAGEPVDANGTLLTAVIAFVAAAVAGLRSIKRAALAGLIAGLAAAFWSGYFSPDYGGLAAFAALIFLLVFTPQQFAIRGASEEF